MVVRPRVAGGLGGQQLLLLRRERDAQGLGDVAGDLVLHLEHVRELAVVALGPQREVGLRLDELRGDAQAVAGAAQRAAEHELRLELLADLRPGHRLVAEGHHGGRGKTRRSLTFDSSVMMSSVMPSRKYSSSFAPLRFSK